MILGVDLGQKTTGLAISEGVMATPFGTIHHQSQEQALDAIARIIEQEKVDTVVVGFVEGKIKSLFENFAQKLRELLPRLRIILWDETLTTRQAKDSMIKLHVPKFKRGQKEHQVAASFLLQSYLDSL